MFSLTRIAAICFLSLLFFNNSISVSALTRAEKKQIKAALEENASLHKDVEDFAECEARVSELDYHNNALRMISKQQLPKIQANAEKAKQGLIAARELESQWRRTFTFAMLGLLGSLGGHLYTFIAKRISDHEEKIKKEKRAAKAEKKRK